MTEPDREPVANSKGRTPDDELTAIKEFLQVIHQDIPGAICIWTKQGAANESRFFPNTSQGLTAAATYTKAKTTKADVYYSVGVLRKALAKGKRGGAKDVAGIACLWADVDFATGLDHKGKSLPPDQASALTILDELPVPPSIIVHSGAGLHAYWLLACPWVFAHEEDRAQAGTLVERWQAMIRRRMEARGWSLDTTHDLARVLRVPNTLHHKDPSNIRPVLVLRPAGGMSESKGLLHRYDTAALEACASAEADECTTAPVQPVQGSQRALGTQAVQVPPQVASLSPFEDYQARGDLGASLLSHGWVCLKTDDQNPGGYWRRPGKIDDGASATFNGTTFFVFSSNAPPFQANRGYNKSQAYAILECGGDLWAAARALRAAGFGERGNGEYPSGKPRVLLPGMDIPISQAASQLGSLLAAAGKHFMRGDVVVCLEQGNDGSPALRPVCPAALSSAIESVAFLDRHSNVGGTLSVVPAICPEQMAKLILNADPFRESLPEIKVVTPCPVLVERDGQLVQVFGFDKQSGILASGKPVPEVSLEQAVRMLGDVLADFRFSTTGDRARATAALITPALVFGGLLPGRPPLDVGEADCSQAGKGFRNKLTAAIYRQGVKTIAQRRGGVGSLEESFASGLIKGYNFISFDNIRGNIDSPAIESFLTEDRFSVRIPYAAPADIDARRTIVQLTSNRAEMTVDLANRSSCVRILKQPSGYQFQTYPEGNILDHVRANQALYLGAVFAIIRAWHAAGKAHTPETRHDFCGWARTLDWIVQHLLRIGPLLDGHQETQAQMTTQSLDWLVNVAEAACQAGRDGYWLRTSHLLEIITSAGIEAPGCPAGNDLESQDARARVLQAMGRRLAKCLATNMVEVKGYRIERRQEYNPGQRRETQEYRFLRL